MKRYIPFVLLIQAISLTGCHDKPRSNDNEIAMPVTVQELKPGAINQLINTSGTVNATKSVELSSEITGIYQLRKNASTGKMYKLGDKVEKGQVLIHLEDKGYENQTAIDSKKLSLEIAEQEQGKQKALYEKGGVTLSEMRNTEVRVTNAKYDYENAKINLDKMNVVAPFSGVIVSLPHYTEGVRIAQNQPLVSIMSYNKMYMDINLPESAIKHIAEDQPVYITHYTLPRDTLHGVISQLSPAISEETRTFKGFIEVQNKKLKLRPGMFVKADIEVNKADSSIIIPKEVILYNNRKPYVYIVEKNTAISRNITIGLENENHAEVVTGLKKNDNLVIKGYETLKNKAKVKVQQ